MADLMKNMQDVYKRWESKSGPDFSGSNRQFDRSRQLQDIDRNRQRQNFDRNRQPSNYGRYPRQPNFDRRNQQRNYDSRRPFPHRVIRSEPGADFEPRTRNPERFSAIRMPRYRDLAQFKMAPSIAAVSKTRPFRGFCCVKCVPLSKASVPHLYIPSLPICNVLVIPSSFCSYPVILESFIPLYFILQQDTHFSYPDVSYSILESERFLHLVKQGESEDILNTALSPSEKSMAKKTLKIMKSSISPFFIRIAGWILHKVLTSILSSVQVHKGQMEMLRNTNQEDIPIIYVPMHRSHLDYILISYILFMNGLKVPLVAAGENLLIPIFGFLMRHLGAFFVRRKLDRVPGKKDYLYRAVLQTYITECLKAGHSLEVFIEGGRSRNGNYKMPKAGLLSFIVDSVIQGDIEDVYISPVSVSYEKITEGNFVQEQLGKPKVPESFFTTIRSLWTILHSHYGSVRVDFGQPFSLKEYMEKVSHPNVFKNQEIPVVETPPSSPTSTSSSGSGSTCGKGSIVVHKNLRDTIQNLADHITYDATTSAALMSTQLVAFLFITKHRKGATQQQLLCSFEWLRSELEKRKQDVGFSGNSPAVIKHALMLLGKELIGTEIYEKEWWKSSTLENTTMKFVIYKPMVELPYVLELQYYSNAVVPTFLIDSVVVNALYALLDADICYFQLCESKFMVSRQALIEKAVTLYLILDFEFIFVPHCGDALTTITDTIEDLIAKEYLHVAGSIQHTDGPRQKILASRSIYSFNPSDDEDDAYSISNTSQQLKVDLSEESIDYLEFMRNVTGPFIESYWVTACTLLKLIHMKVDEDAFLKAVQDTAQEKLCNGLLHFEESFGIEVMKNAMKLFRSWQVIDYDYKGNDKIFFIVRRCNSEESDHEDNDNNDCDQSQKPEAYCEICLESIDNVISTIEEFRK